MSAFLERLTSPPVQTLRVLQPTSSIAQYTVTTRPVPQTIPTILGHYVGLAVKILVGIQTVLLVLAKWASDPTYGRYYQASSWMSPLLDNIWGTALLRLLHLCEWTYLVPCALVILYLVIRRGYTGMLPQHNHHHLKSIADALLCRRVPDRASWPRRPNLHHVFHIPADTHYTLHTHD